MDLLVDDVDRAGTSLWGLRFNYNKNSLNKQFFASKGSFFDLDLKYPIYSKAIYSGSDSSFLDFKKLLEPTKKYIKLKISLNQHIAISSKFNISYKATIGAATNDMEKLQYFNLGGLESTARTKDIPFIGLSPREITAQQFAVGKLDLRYEAINKLFITLTGNVLNYKSNFKDLDYHPDSETIIFGGGLLLSYSSILGPIELGYSRSTLHNKNRWYITVGFPF